MGFTSYDDFINEITTNSKFRRVDWNKLTFGTTNHTGGTWYSLLGGGGNPTANTLLGAGTNLAFQSLSETTANAGSILHGGNVSPDTKHLLSGSAFTASAGTMPAVFLLVDFLGFYPITTVTTTGAQTLNNTVTLPRYTSGAGVQAFLTPSTVMGAGTPTVTITYTNSAGTAGQTTPTNPSLPVINTTAPVTQIAYSGTGTGKYGPFIPLASGDAGIRSVQSINFNATMTSGVMNLVLCRPIAEFPMTTIGVAAERSFIDQIPSYPQIVDGACLGFLMYAGTTTPTSSPFYGHLNFGWG
jgi:hypothetical protein